jgi:rhodanese-related sulfurtransferase
MSEQFLAIQPPTSRSKVLHIHQKALRLAGGLPSLSLSDLRDLSLPLLVDVRTAVEMNVSVVQGSLTPSAFDSVRVQASTSHRPVVAICTVGLRAGLWARQLNESGLYDGEIYVYEGVLMHALNGGEMVAPIEAETGDVCVVPVSRVHCFCSRFQLAPDGWDMPVFSSLRAASYCRSYIVAFLSALYRDFVWPRSWSTYVWRRATKPE